MSLRESNKQQNRHRILRAAEAIIREDGIDRLSMRHLGERAGVSLRTPYNLFGSKTRVLIALLQEPLADVLQDALQAQAGSTLRFVFAALARAHARFTPEERFFRDTYWQVMCSDQQEARSQTIQQALALAQPLIERCVAEGELEAGDDLSAFSRNLTLVAFALFGMWAGSQLSLDELAAEVRYALASSLLSRATPASRPFLLAMRAGQSS